jgi:hypothetical protein
MLWSIWSAEKASSASALTLTKSEIEHRQCPSPIDSRPEDNHPAKLNLTFLERCVISTLINTMTSNHLGGGG